VYVGNKIKNKYYDLSVDILKVNFRITFRHLKLVTPYFTMMMSLSPMTCQHIFLSDVKT
jgi:hypothetical protein